MIAYLACPPYLGFNAVFMDVQTKKSRVAALSVLSNAVLVTLKFIIGTMIGSVSVISEAIHSSVDLLASCIALFAVRKSAEAADEEHPFGHGKIENISGTVEALLIFLAAGWIIYEAAHKLSAPQPIETAGWGVVVMLASAIVNLFVSQRLFRVGRETDSVALQADAWHLRTDVYTSAGVMFGLIVILLGQRAWPGHDLNWVDPVAAIAVALLIIKSAYTLTIESGVHLLDVKLPDTEQAWIIAHIISFNPEVKSYHKLRTRKAGSERFVDVHIRVAGNSSVRESHTLAHKIIDGIKLHLPGTSVSVHVEPD